MARTKDDVTVDFDPHASVRITDPALQDTHLQRTCPVAWSEQHDGFWYFTEYENVARIGKEHGTFSNCDGVILPVPPYGRIAMVYDDPPVHTAYRRALNPTLSKQRVAEVVQPRIEYWTDFYIDRVIGAGSCDLMYDIAVPIPAAVTLEWLGLEDQEEWPRIGAAWHDIFSRAHGTPAHEEAAATIEWFDGRISEELLKRRESPRDDVLTQVGELVIEGETIDHDAAVSIVRILIGAGLDTTTSLLGKAFVHLYYNPDQRRRLIEEPDLWETATEELLRRYTPTRGIFRTCVKETQVGDFTIAPGEHVLGSILGANLQEDVFEDPLEVKLDRSPNKHLGFGIGVHKCIGMHLARAEFVHVMTEMLNRMPEYDLIEDELVEYARQGTMSGWMTLPATFPAAAPPEAELG